MESSPARSPSRPSRGPASFSTQANALLRKNLTFQKRNMKTNIGIIAFPVFLCLVLFVLKKVIDSELNKAKYRCGCVNGICGVQYSTTDQVDTCPIPSPPKWPDLMQVPAPEFRAVRTDILPSVDLPDESCRASRSCPAITLFTGANKSFAQINSSDNLSFLSTVTPGTDTPTALTQFIEPAFISIGSLYALQPQCTSNVTREISFDFAGINIRQDLKCAQGLPLWRDSSSSVNEELYKGYRQGNLKGKINEFLAAFDFLNTDEKRFNLVVWYNSTYNNDTAYDRKAFVRAPRSVNVASNAYLKFLKGTNVEIRFEYVKEMPKPATENRDELSSIIGALFFTWIVQLLFPVALKSLVYEKQQKLNMMMKMHGLKDGPYWLISYIYYFTLSSIYMICFVIFGSHSSAGLKLFTSNDYSIQAVFYFICINLQITLAFLVTSFFSSVKTATVIAYMYLFGSSLLGDSVLRTFVERSSFPRGWIIVMELVPAFSLYRGLYEFGQYSSTGDSMGTSGMRWGNLSDSENGMKIVLTIMTAEWLILLPLAFYLDQISIFGDGTKRHPLFFLHHYRKKSSNLQQRLSLQKESSKVYVEMEGPDVAQERDVVEQLLIQPSITHPVISDNLKLVYPGQDGNPDKFAVRGLSLALANGECFGMLGPNGAGKTSFINMMIGLIKPTSGTAYVEGMDISTDMDEVYSNMGVCPQHDLLWETLTGKEHLLFYGRLKNLKGAALMLAVEESLKSVNLYYGGVGDKQAGKYSGGMKRRLSVAISLIGDPKVVYMDEPSTGLDPASRNNLWTVLKRAKTDRAIILTTHSMEEAEVLCDRLGIFVDGNFRCIGNPNELKARYGSSYVFTITTSADQESKVESLVRQLSPNANKICHISGTQKFELPKQEVKISEVFRAIQFAKSNFSIQAWGLAGTTLEDVFIKVAKGVV